MRPGWVRVNIHYTLNKDDIKYILESIEFIASYGYLFLSLYNFDIESGNWTYNNYKDNITNFSIDNDFNIDKIDINELQNIRNSYLEEAKELAIKLKKSFKSMFPPLIITPMRLFLI